MSSQIYHELMRPVLTIEKSEIAGYVDPWVASPGDEVEVKVCRPSSIRCHTLDLVNRSPALSPSMSTVWFASFKALIPTCKERPQHIGRLSRASHQARATAAFKQLIRARMEM